MSIWESLGALNAIQMAALGYSGDAWSDSVGAWGTILSPSWTPLGHIGRFWTFLGIPGATLGSFLVSFVDDLDSICGRFQENLERRAHKPVECSSHNRFDQTHPKLLSVSADLSALKCHRPTKQIQNFCHFMQTLVHANAIVEQTKSKTCARNFCQLVQT